KMTDQYTTIIIIAMALSFCTSTIFAVIIIRRARMKQGGLFNFAKNIPGNLTPGKEVSGILNGRDYFQLYTPGGKNVPSSYTIKIECPSSGVFSINRETGFDRFFKSLGITREIQTGDKKFDQKFFINTNSLEFTRAFFMNPEKCLTVKNIFEHGFTRVEHDGKTMAAICSPVQFKEELDQTVIQKIVSFLEELSEHINEHPGEGILQGSQDWKIKRIVAFSIPILLFIVGIPTFFLGLFEYTPLDKWELFLTTLKFSAPSFLFFLIIALKLIKGRSSSHRELIIILALSLVAFPGAGMGVGSFLNGWLDQSGSTSHEVLVMEKYTTSTKNGKNYHLILKSWRENRYSEKLRVSSSEYMRVKPDRTKMKVVTKPGHYGFEWVVSAGIT
ncbi:MAG: hypothetical protein R3339_09765, partial [Thermodesulfobacteriota bacterium]|nr:hypothetical protein [Thermodesulfobacteriota bacterium]